MSERRRKLLPRKLLCFRRNRQFHLFSELSDELQQLILSFVADAPFENLSKAPLHGAASTGTLTHTLPLVCWKFYELCETEILWQQVFQRAVDSDPIWHSAHKRYMDAHEQWREIAKDYLRTNLIGSINKYFYQQVLREIRFTGPVFILRMARTLDHYGLNFFEPRYRLMMLGLMEAQPLAARNGEEITEPVMFLHAHEGLPLTEKSTALLVKIERCHMGVHGHSHVDLRVVATVRVERVWVRSGSGGLHYAQTLRIRER